jgi:hypothetical protein
MNSERILEILRSYAEQLPTLLTYTACLIFALTRWKRYPKVSLTVAIALAIFLLQAIIFTLVYAFVPDYFIRSASSQDIQTVVRNVYLVLGLISYGVSAVALAVLLIGIFMKRRYVTTI